jgi:hypothetical protein
MARYPPDQGSKGDRVKLMQRRYSQTMSCCHHRPELPILNAREASNGGEMHQGAPRGIMTKYGSPRRDLEEPASRSRGAPWARATRRAPWPQVMTGMTANSGVATMRGHRLTGERQRWRQALKAQKTQNWARGGRKRWPRVRNKGRPQNYRRRRCSAMRQIHHHGVINDDAKRTRSKEIKPHETRDFNVENSLNTRGKNHGRQPSSNFTMIRVRLQTPTAMAYKE